MKKAIKNSSKAMIATLCVAATSLLAQNSTTSTATGNGTTTGTSSTSVTENRNNQPVDQSNMSSSEDSGIMKLNKGSKLIGSEVQNPQGDKLGKIEDIVVDYNKGKVSYCVLEVEHSLFSTPKYIAVPLSAFRPNADGTRLILNADKDRVAQAQGFDRNNWPSASSPSWGAQPFWQQPSSTSTGSQYNGSQYNGASSQGTPSSSSSAGNH